ASLPRAMGGSNVRELENAARRIVVLGTALTVHQEIAARLGDGPRPAVTPSAVTATVNPEQMISLKDIARRAARDAERVAINEVLDRVHWNRAKAARLLQIDSKTLQYKIEQCGLGTREEQQGTVAMAVVRGLARDQGSTVRLLRVLPVPEL